MKRLTVLIMITAFLGVSSSAYAFRMYDNNGTDFGGACDNGSAFAGVIDNAGWYTVSGPNGTHFGQSMGSVIQKACGE